LVRTGFIAVSVDTKLPKNFKPRYLTRWIFGSRINYIQFIDRTYLFKRSSSFLLNAVICRKIRIMRLPIIKHLNEFVKENDADYIDETITVLEALAEAKGIRDEELEVMGELLSNMYGALEVQKLIHDEGMTDKDALNTFMKRVQGAIEK